MGTNGFTMKRDSFGKILPAAQAGDTQEDSVHGRDEAYENENEEENQVHQLGDTSPTTLS